VLGTVRETALYLCRLLPQYVAGILLGTTLLLVSIWSLAKKGKTIGQRSASLAFAMAGAGMALLTHRFLGDEISTALRTLGPGDWPACLRAALPGLLLVFGVVVAAFRCQQIAGSPARGIALFVLLLPFVPISLLVLPWGGWWPGAIPRRFRMGPRSHPRS
jgi:hypothetical protein